MSREQKLLYRENKNATLGKNALKINEFTEIECLPIFEFKFKFLNNLRRPSLRM